MAEETLRVIIDYADLDIALAKLRSAELLSGKVGTMGDEARYLKRTIEHRDVRQFIRELPTITRAQRLLVTQLPMMREALQLTFRAKLLAGTSTITALLVLAVYLNREITRIKKDIQI